MVRCLLADSGLPHFLWGELFLTASYLCNRAPHSALNHETPYKTLHGKDADLRRLRVIGARAFVHVETHQKKLDPRAWEGRVVGFGQNSLAYRVYHAVSRESRNVIFIETHSVVPSPDFVTAFDEGTFAYDEPDDLVRDVRNFLPRKDLGSSSFCPEALLCFYCYTVSHRIASMGVTAVGLLLLEFALVVEMGRSGTYRAPLGSSSALLLLLLRVILVSLGLVVVVVGFGGIRLAVSNLPADVALYTSEVFLAWRCDAASCN